MSYKIHTGLCQDVLAEFEPNSIDAIVTDPPYGLSFMGKKWDYEVPSVEIWQACLRVLKPGGHLLAFAGTRTQHRMAVNIEDAGFEIRDMIAWVYGSGFPKSHNIGKAVDKLQGNEREVVGKDKSGSDRKCMAGDFAGGEYDLTKGNSEWEGWGTALKPALEPITVARKPFKGTVAENVLEHGTGGLNIDGCRVEMNGSDTKILQAKSSKNPTGVKSVFGGGIASRPHTKGRFPANLIHDGSDEVVGLFPHTTSGNLNRGHQQSINKGGVLEKGSKNEQNYIQKDYGGDSGSAARFFYCAKSSKADRDEGLGDFDLQAAGGMKGRNDGSMGSITISRNYHPTVKPTALMRYLCRLVTPPNGTVLDPFAGSGSTGKGAILEGFTPILIEADEQWADIIKARCDFALKQYKKQNAQTSLF